ncbi:hypothetical protein SAMN05421636_102360 [Pricia antarctica]|uniref:Uncharacterized protein n=1 Tax=Pricia antarctica TaxID=641691 RepID=A0A1G6YUL2_9FLAO|nr:DUF5908 family protein [Pricia antarctica]SDD93325.1 hypothetical protein SAMN05421636_102360 [Pricia antarctica]
MPIEIRELIVKVKVNERENNNAATTDPNARKQERDASEDAIIAECVEQTLLVLNKKKER